MHAAFYKYVKSIEREGKAPEPQFRPAHAPGSLKGQVLLLDEVSLIDHKMAAEILATGVTVVAVGDPGQLPPVSGNPFFTQASFTLQQIHRQALESPILRQAHAVRTSGCYTSDGDAVRVAETLTVADLRNADVVLVWRRATRSRMNTLCRRARGISAPLPLHGEPLVCLRNLPKYGLYNGAIYPASRDLQDTDVKVGISTDAGDVEVYADFHLPGAEDNPLDLPPGGWKTAFAFGYALTVHKAQGSEFASVLIIDENGWQDRLAWLYTAITRAVDRVVITKSTAADR